ncbi:PKD domain-containing protein [Bacteroidia bacterium]|nr:PKD domain-containing protein [Bacteroidia bacterium]MDB9882923.1 PKD domain-containing protein [Bacteroidia bacterium]
MLKSLLVTLVLFSSFLSFSQLTSVSATIIDDLSKQSAYHPNLKSKSATNPVSCLPDTLEYARYKATSLQGISVSNGFSLGQYFDAPDSVEVSGVTFYGWVVSSKNERVDVTVSLYEAGTDTLPTGSAIRTAIIKLDTTFGGGQLSAINQNIEFLTPYKTDKPYIITISSSDSVRTAIVCNSYASADGLGENIACGTVSNVWYRCLNLNIAGTTLDCDVILEPHVSYKTYAEFSFDDCYNYQDSISPINTSSKIINHRMYNRYVYYGLGQYSYYWYFPGTGTLYGEAPKKKFNVPTNTNIRLITTMYGYRSGVNCRDTAYQDLYYNPAPVTTNTDTPVCEGNATSIVASSNAKIYWYSSASSTSLIDSGNVYTTPILTSSSNYYALAANNNCVSALKKIILPVAKKPKLLSVSNDSICLKAKANLTATTDYGKIIWWTDSLGGIPIDTGSIHTTASLNKTILLYAEANNRGCRSENRVKLEANVNANNAPSAPITTTDSLICITNGNVSLTAQSPSNDSLFWYETPSGGSVFHSGSTYLYSPNKIGVKYLYVEAFDGQCASSRIQKKIQTWTFPYVKVQDADTLCSGDTLQLDYSTMASGIRWYDSPDGIIATYDTNVLDISSIAGTKTYYLEPYSVACRDTQRHSVSISELHPGNLSGLKGDEICQNEKAILNTSSDAGEVLWCSEEHVSSLLSVGSSYETEVLNEATRYYVASRNIHCVSDFTEVNVSVKNSPSAGFDYQVNSLGNFTLEAKAQGLQYEWDMGDENILTGRKVTHQFVKNGDFEVSLTTTNAEKCKTTNSKILKVLGLITGVEQFNKSNIGIYPNPTRLSFTVDWPLEKALLNIQNSLGQRVANFEIGKGKNKINLIDFKLNSGIYHIVFENETNLETSMLVIE